MPIMRDLSPTYDLWRPVGLRSFHGVGARPELRFEEKNAYRQCKACNGGSGRFAAKNATVHARYRETLIEWYGLPLVEWLEGPHEAKHYSKEDTENIAAKYRRKTRELKAEGRMTRQYVKKSITHARQRQSFRMSFTSCVLPAHLNYLQKQIRLVSSI